MPQKTLLLIVSLSVIFVTAIVTLVVNVNSPNTVSKSELDTAVNQARYLLYQKIQRGENLSNGPCISNALMPGWVVDIVHNPREPIDDLPGNQCSDYIEGRVKHIVEIDTLGNIIRAQ